MLNLLSKTFFKPFLTNYPTLFLVRIPKNAIIELILLMIPMQV